MGRTLRAAERNKEELDEDDADAGAAAMTSGDDSGVHCTALLAAGADVNAKDQRGSTALMIASQYGHLEIVNALRDPMTVTYVKK